MAAADGDRLTVKLDMAAGRLVLGVLVQAGDSREDANNTATPSGPPDKPQGSAPSPQQVRNSTKQNSNKTFTKSQKYWAKLGGGCIVCACCPTPPHQLPTHIRELAPCVVDGGEEERNIPAIPSPARARALIEGKRHSRDTILLNLDPFCKLSPHNLKKAPLPRKMSEAFWHWSSSQASLFLCGKCPPVSLCSCLLLLAPACLLLLKVREAS